MTLFEIQTLDIATATRFIYAEDQECFYAIPAGSPGSEAIRLDTGLPTITNETPVNGVTPGRLGQTFLVGSSPPYVAYQCESINPTVFVKLIKSADVAAALGYTPQNAATALQIGTSSSTAAAGNHKHVTPTSGTAPLSAKAAHADINPPGSVLNKMRFAAKVPGTAGNVYSLTLAIGGGSISHSTSGNNWIVNIPVGGVSALAVVAYVNANSAFPFSGINKDAGTALITAPIASTALAGGTNGTAGTVGDEVVFTGDANTVLYRCLKSSPIEWSVISNNTVVRKLPSSTLVAVPGSGYDVMCFWNTAPSYVNLFSSTFAHKAGQQITIVVPTDTPLTVSSSLIMRGSTPVTLLAGVPYTWLCLDERGYTEWQLVVTSTINITQTGSASPMYLTSAPVNATTNATDGQLVRVSTTIGVPPFTDYLCRRSGNLSTTTFQLVNPVTTSSITLGTVTTANHTLNPTDALIYHRCTFNGAKVFTIPVVGTSIVPGTIVTVRNAGTGSLTLTPASLAVQLDFSTGADIVTSKTTAQLLYVGSDIWDIL